MADNDKFNEEIDSMIEAFEELKIVLSEIAIKIEEKASKLLGD